MLVEILYLYLFGEIISFIKLTDSMMLLLAQTLLRSSRSHAHAHTTTWGLGCVLGVAGGSWKMSSTTDADCSNPTPQIAISPIRRHSLVVIHTCLGDVWYSILYTSIIVSLLEPLTTWHGRQVTYEPPLIRDRQLSNRRTTQLAAVSFEKLI